MEELEEKIRALRDKQFMLNMKDRWDNSDYRYSNELHQQIMELENKLKELKDESNK